MEAFKVLEAARQDINVYRVQSNLMDWLKDLTCDMDDLEAQRVLNCSALEVGNLRGGRLSQLPVGRLRSMWKSVQRWG